MFKVSLLHSFPYCVGLTWPKGNLFALQELKKEAKQSGRSNHRMDLEAEVDQDELAKLIQASIHS